MAINQQSADFLNGKEITDKWIARYLTWVK